GKVVHGSRPWEGVNPIETLLKATADIKALFPKIGPNTSSISMNVIHAGKTINQIPVSASASYDIRPVSLEEQANLYNEINKIAERYHVRLTTEAEAQPLINDPSNEYLKLYKACTEAVIGRPIKWTLSNAGSDARYFAPFGTVFAIAYPEGG